MFREREDQFHVSFLVRPKISYLTETGKRIEREEKRVECPSCLTIHQKRKEEGKLTSHLHNWLNDSLVVGFVVFRHKLKLS